MHVRDDESIPKIGIWLGVAHASGSALNYFILTNRGKLITLTTVQHPMEKEVQNTDVQPLIRDYHASMHAAIGAAVVVNLEDDKTYFYEDELRDHMKAEGHTRHIWLERY